MKIERIDTPFGPMKCVTDDSFPENQLMMVTPGEKLVVSDIHGNILREVWIRKPSATVITNIGT